MDLIDLTTFTLYVTTFITPIRKLSAFVEQFMQDVLLHDADLGPKGVLLQVPHVLAVQENAALGHVVKPGNQLARAGGHALRRAKAAHQHCPDFPQGPAYFDSG